MMVGDPFASKTSVLMVLAQTLNLLFEKKYDDENVNKASLSFPVFLFIFKRDLISKVMLLLSTIKVLLVNLFLKTFKHSTISPKSLTLFTNFYILPASRWLNLFPRDTLIPFILIVYLPIWISY